MRHIVAIILAASTIILGQPPKTTPYSVYDEYYSDILLRHDDVQTIGTKIRYPGLHRDTLATFGFGYLPQHLERAHLFSEIQQKTFTLQSDEIQSGDFYSWAEKTTRFGRLGIRLGSLSVSNHADDNIDSRWETRNSGQGTIWYIPQNHPLLKGVSADISQRRWADSVFDSRAVYSEMDKHDNTLFSLKLRSLIQLEHGRHLLFGYERKDSVAKTNNNYRYYDSTGLNTGSYTTTYTSTLHSNQITAGILSTNGSRLNLVFSYTSSDYVNHNSTGRYSGELGIYLEGATSKRLDYLKHSLRMTLYGLAGSSATATNSIQHIDFDYARDNFSNTRDNTSTIGIIRTPCVADINLFGSAIYGVISVTPELYGNYFRRIENEGTAKGYAVQLTVQQLSAGLRGYLGKKLEFLLVPSLQSNIFVSSLEIRYLL